MNSLRPTLFAGAFGRARLQRASSRRLAVSLVGILLLLGGPTATLSAKEPVEPGTAQRASTPPKLPSAEKVVESYLKAVGGKKRLAAIKDATYEWTIQLKSEPVGIA
ncbi:MAG TPA: hypothetical protein VMS31_02510, partial [Pyrinomonadaceae bacterium]|nr:hypothetical protein [Pyrinomonadaceae bacterium]